ncbi:hypothetical protein ATO3_18345 [Marinibacterium profundimaris]|uniref:Glycosyltransferase 61 catalytic domain-containing protein n=2 Tax=Marinibacterium profundimaris TaxID=1679460 RepID=A0A225NEP1_9RHOB|nr:hypothetical protein ATO3_18345 [Marinibacterium profundimaris]
MFSLRRSLVTRLGPEEGFGTFRRLVPPEHLPPGDSLRLLALTEMAQAARDTGAVRVIAPAGRPIEAAPPRVIGEGNHRTLRKTGREIFAGTLEDVQLQGASGAMIAGDRLIWDYEGTEIADTLDAIDFDPAIVAFDPATGRVQTPAIDPGAMPEVETAFNMLGWSSGHFGHWMMEFLPKFMLALLHDGLAEGSVVLVDEAMPSSHFEAISLLLPEGASLQRVPRFTPVRARRLQVVSSLNYPVLAPQSDAIALDQAAVDPDLFSTAARAMGERLETAVPSGDGPDKVFLSRRGIARRSLVNTDEIEEIARAAGFAIVQPETMGFADQFRLLRDAKVVAGPEGSAMMLGMFCRPGTRGLVLNHQHTEYLATLSAALERGGVDITVLTGPREEAHGKFAHNASYRIDPARARRLLNEASISA